MAERRRRDTGGGGQIRGRAREQSVAELLTLGFGDARDETGLAASARRERGVELLEGSKLRLFEFFLGDVAALSPTRWIW